MLLWIVTIMISLLILKKIDKVSRYKIAIKLISNWGLSIDKICLVAKIPIKQRNEVKEIKKLMKLEFGTILKNHDKSYYGFDNNNNNNHQPYSSTEQNFLFLFRNYFTTSYLNRLLRRNRKTSYSSVLDGYYFDRSCFSERMANIIGATIEDFEGNAKDFSAYKFYYK